MPNTHVGFEEYNINDAPIQAIQSTHAGQLNLRLEESGVMSNPAKPACPLALHVDTAKITR
jgi:hypothetical protein